MGAYCKLVVVASIEINELQNNGLKACINLAIYILDQLSKRSELSGGAGTTIGILGTPRTNGSRFLSQSALLNEGEGLEIKFFASKYSQRI
jgi:hypothetical protein